MAARQLRAQYTSRCRNCRVTITPGEQIMWQQGRGSWHVVCPEKAAEAPAPSSTRVKAMVATLEDAPFVVFEKHDHRVNAVGETRRYEKRLPTVRDGAPAGTTAAPGVYVIVAQDGYYQTREQNEDMGDCSGPGWEMTFYLRFATPEEAEKDAQDRLAEGLPKVFAAAAAMLQRIEARKAREAFDAETAGLVRTGAWNWTAIKASGIFVEGQEGEVAATWPINDRYKATARRYTTAAGERWYILDLSTFDWDHVLFVAPIALAELVWEAMLAARPVSVEAARKTLAGRSGACFGDELYEHVLRRAGVWDAFQAERAANHG